MRTLPPSWAMGAAAIEAADDPHLAEGIHLRVFTALELGLPVRPFVVYRVPENELQRLFENAVGNELNWVDSHGRVLTPPFEVKPDNPVTGFVPRAPGVRCIAVALNAGGHYRRPVVTHVPARLPQFDLTMEAFFDGPEGRRTLGRRDTAPYALAASDIHGVVVRGAGIVQAASWVRAENWVRPDSKLPEQVKPSFTMGLPVHLAERYEGWKDAPQQAIQRVYRGAPKRFGLHDDVSVSGPFAAAPATPSDEAKRVEALAKDIEPHLDRVLNDLSATPHRLGITQQLGEGVKPGAHADAKIMSLNAVLTATADPGVARWLGFMDVDPLQGAEAGSSVLYFIRGFFAIDPRVLNIAQRLSLPRGAMLTADLTDGLPFVVPHRSRDNLPVYDFTVPVLVFPGAPPARPAPPEIGAPLAPSKLVGPKGSHPPATGDGQGPWLADAVPPRAVREVVLPLSGLESASSLAAARLDGSGLNSLNDRHPATGRALALVPALPDNAEESGTGRLHDRTVPPESVTYRIASADWFGRWSEWRTRTIPAKTRPLPPAPSFEVHYDIAPAAPLDDAPRFGKLRVRLNVPRPEDLAPGSRLLKRGKVEAIIGGVAVSAEADLASPAQRHLDIFVPPPAGLIQRASQVTASVNARWNDGTADGPLGEPQQRVLVDPRPPKPLTIDPSLRYSARPDAVGRANIVLEWPAAPGTRYRVYTTDETRMLGALRERAAAGDQKATALLDALEEETNPELRAQLFTDAAYAELYEKALFTNLTAEPLAATGAGTLRFSHDLSGSLEVLAFFKIVALSEHNVESPFTGAALLPVAVPSGGPPPRPLLDFLEWTEDGHARLRVTAVRGPQPAVRWRLRRSFASSEDPLRMPIVAEGTVPVTTGEDGPATFEIEDAGTDAAAGGTLRPWTRTTWRVEVQAPDLPGSDLPGEWSPSSGPAGSMRVPPPPSAPVNLRLESVAPEGITLAWTHGEPLQKGSQGGYRFDIYRRAPDGTRETRAGTVLADDPGAVSGAGSDRMFRFTDAPQPPGTVWRIVVMDPLGRLSPPSTEVIYESTE